MRPQWPGDKPGLLLPPPPGVEIPPPPPDPGVLVPPPPPMQEVPVLEGIVHVLQALQAATTPVPSGPPLLDGFAQLLQALQPLVVPGQLDQTSLQSFLGGVTVPSVVPGHRVQVMLVPEDRPVPPPAPLLLVGGTVRGELLDIPPPPPEAAPGPANAPRGGAALRSHEDGSAARHMEERRAEPRCVPVPEPAVEDSGAGAEPARPSSPKAPRRREPEKSPQPALAGPPKKPTPIVFAGAKGEAPQPDPPSVAAPKPLPVERKPLVFGEAAGGAMAAAPARRPIQERLEIQQRPLAGRLQLEGEKDEEQGRRPEDKKQQQAPATEEERALEAFLSEWQDPAAAQPAKKVRIGRLQGKQWRTRPTNSCRPAAGANADCLCRGSGTADQEAACRGQRDCGHRSCRRLLRGARRQEEEIVEGHQHRLA